jgi:hypothetical protein
MLAPEDRLLRVYLDARLAVSRHLDDPTPVAGAWTALRAVELMLLERGWSEADLDAAFVEHEHQRLRELDMEGWRAHLVRAMERSTERSMRIAQALARYREPAGPHSSQ